MEGNFEGSSTKLVSVMSDFVEEQKNKDLLDVSLTGPCTTFHGYRMVYL